MFWFIPMIMSAVAGQMQQNNQRANGVMQTNANRLNNDTMRLPNVNSRNNIYNRIMNKNADSNTPTANSLYNYMTDSQQADTSPISKEINTPSAYNSPISNSIATTPSVSSSDAVSNSTALSGNNGGGSGGGWMSMANSLMGLMGSNKTPTAEFNPTMTQPNYITTANNANNFKANMANIGKRNLYNYLAR